MKMELFDGIWASYIVHFKIIYNEDGNCLFQNTICSKNRFIQMQKCNTSHTRMLVLSIESIFNYSANPFNELLNYFFFQNINIENLMLVK